MSTYSGNCLCGDVGFVCEGEPFFTQYCHCNKCREVMALSRREEDRLGYAWTAGYLTSKFKMTHGQDKLNEIIRNQARLFLCSSCGSQIYGISLDPAKQGGIGVNVNNFKFEDNKLPESFKPVQHIWYENHIVPFHDALPKFKDAPKNQFGTGELYVSDETNSASQYFNENWKKYQKTLACNTLYHREMMAQLQEFLQQHFSHKPFSLVDVGCGDASALVDVLKLFPVNNYVGIDAASAVLELAAVNTANLACDKSFICRNMQTAVRELTNLYDVIFTSYAAHHLTLAEKNDFLQDCYDKLNDGGFLVMVDGVLLPHQSRDEWLQTLAARMQSTQQMSPAEVEERMRHPRAEDFPVEIATYQEMAHKQSWKQLSVPLQKEIFAFIVFVK